jgi:hypothetical protein
MRDSKTGEKAMKAKSNSKKWTLLTLAVIAGVSWGSLLRPLVPQLVVKTPLTAQQIVTRDLSWAREQGMSGVKQDLAPIHELFSHGREGTRLFVDDALGWSSKWKLVSDFVTRSDAHAEYLKAQFEQHIFSDEQLESAVEEAINSYLKHLDDVDSLLLVKLQADLASVPAAQLARGVDKAAIRQILDEALGEARDAARSDLGGMLEREIASWVAGEVLTAVGVELATSTGILSAGAASGMVTVGAGVIVGIIADWAVSWAYDRMYDPVGELTNKVNEQLNGMEQMILVGDAEHPGLEVRLLTYAQERAEARNTAIQDALLHQPEPAPQGAPPSMGL